MGMSHRFVRTAWRTLAVLTALLALGIAGGWYWLRGSLPPLAGELSLPGLQAPVSIVRDAAAVPHIRAQNVHDAWFALGVVHAQDRLWQMEMSRRIAGGRIAEALGATALDTDRLLRTMGLRRVAERNYRNLDAESRAVLDAYAAGVNAWIAAHGGPLPPEFLLTGVRPEAWQPADSLSWLKVMALDLGSNWSGELTRLRLARQLPTARIQDFLPPVPYAGPLPVADYAALYRGLDLPLAALGPQPRTDTDGLGSNNWVVAGSRSASGKPLLANDPHLGLTAPAIWYFAHLEAPGLRVIGATLPGVPMVVIGRNERIAWGLTNTNPDVQDLYVERSDPADPGRYQTPDGWQRFEQREEILHVRNAPDERLTVRTSRHGPLLPDTRTGDALPAGYGLALAWTALAEDDASFRAASKLAYAQDWTGFNEALREFVAPQQNFVYADVDGHIGFLSPGRIPVRRPDNDLLGLAPAPGWEARYDWAGWVPYEELPRVFDPADGALYSANERIVPPGYRWHLTDEWQPAYRAARIRELLAATPAHTPASFRQMHADIRSGLAADLLPKLLQRAAATDYPPAARVWHERLARWDYGMRADAAEPLVFSAWYRALTRRIYADELGPEFERLWDQRTTFMNNVLDDRDGQGLWCDDVRTAATESCAQQVVAALGEALDELHARFGSDESRWHWGDAHPAVAEHRPFSKLAWLRPLFELRRPVGGDVSTLDVARFFINDVEAPYAARHVASLRMIVDLADPDRSTFMHSSGQSGNPLSPHYADLLDRWTRVESLPMSMQARDYEAGALGTLTLRPPAAVSGGQ